MRHFKTKKEAVKFRDTHEPNHKIFKKIKGQKNRIQKPFLVGTDFQWLNQY